MPSRNFYYATYFYCCAGSKFNIQNVLYSEISFVCYINFMDEKTFLERLHEIGGEAYIAGGWVRDMVMGREPHDKDYVVCGSDYEIFAGTFPDAEKIGGRFPVFLMNIDGVKREVAFARTEIKNGSGHRGFDIRSGRNLNIEDDLYRRDTTMNSMAWSPVTGEIIDPFGGKEDIACRIIRATSCHFLEDPVRALRAARQAAQFGFHIDPHTVGMMKKCAPELANEPKERVVAEIMKALGTPKPSVFFRALKEAELLETVFPWLDKLIGKIQPAAYHPEGDAFDHTMEVLDIVSEMNGRIEVRFAALMHDIGKGETPYRMLPDHNGHEKRGLEVLDEISKKMRIPRIWFQCAAFAIAEHSRPAKMNQPAEAVDLLLRLYRHPIGFDGFTAIIKADNYGEEPEFLLNHEKYLRAIHLAHKVKIPEHISGKNIGHWMRNREIEAYINELGEKNGDGNNSGI